MSENNQKEDLEKKLDEARMYLREWHISEESDLRTRMIELLTSEINKLENEKPHTDIP